MDTEFLVRPRIVRVSMGALGKLIDRFPHAQKALKPFEGHVAGLAYPPEAMGDLRREGALFEDCLKEAEPVVSPDFLERDYELMNQMHGIYKAYDDAIDGLKTKHAVCEELFGRFRLGRLGKGEIKRLKAAVEDLDSQVVAAREANVENEHIRDVQITLTAARANMRVLNTSSKGH